MICDVINRIKSLDGVEALDITNDSLASEHVRYMSGGRCQSTNDEYLFRILLPERVGSEGSLFSALDSNWNISLYHYRNHGGDFGRILLGLQIKDRKKDSLDGFYEKLKGIGSKECVEETSNPIYKYFYKI